VTRIRRLNVLMAVVVLVGAVASSTAGASSSASDTDALVKAACSLTKDELMRMDRGVMPGRSGQILIVAHEPDFVGANYPHSGPWDYLQRVPMLFYGPGYIPANGKLPAPVTMADVSPTEAELLHYDFPAPDGKPMPGALVPADQRQTPPRLIFNLVYDAGGRDVLDTWNKEWPMLHSLIPKGVWYENATAGSSPSITPAIHSSLGTGAYPDKAGQVDADFELNGSPARSGDIGPGYEVEPTLADLYDRAMGNKPLVGNVATVNWHQNMLGHGAMWGGGDKDIEVLRQGFASEGTEGDLWNLNKENIPFFTFPKYVNHLPPLSTYIPSLDEADGKKDGKWRSNSIAQLREGWDSPARFPFETNVIETVLKREHFGQDSTPDLFYSNYKVIDDVGHMWSLNSPEMKDAVAWQDQALGDLVKFLDKDVGKGKYVLMVTADHGHQYSTQVSGGYAVSPGQLQLDLNARFDTDGNSTPAIRDVRDTQIFVNQAELAKSGYSLEDVSKWILSYTEGQANPPGQTAPDPSHQVFQAAFPMTMLRNLPCMPDGAP
jgi:type I phosphodiesterase/nucleotide pyrophosphatase